MSFFSKLWKGVKGAVIGGVTGGPVGAIAGGVGGLLGGARTPGIRMDKFPTMPGSTGLVDIRPVITPQPSPTGFPPQPWPPVLRPGQPRNAGQLLQSLPSMGTPAIAGPSCPKGFHLAKDGSGRCVRNRRMDPCNPRALRRATRRLSAYTKQNKRIERELRKLAPPRRRAPARRTYSGPHHTH